MAPRDIVEGKAFGAAIVEAIHDSRVIVLLFSFTANRSKQIVRELKLADDAGKAVIPVRLDDLPPSGDFAYFLGTAQWLDAIGGPKPEHLDRLRNAVRTYLQPVPAASVSQTALPANPKPVPLGSLPRDQLRDRPSEVTFGSHGQEGWFSRNLRAIVAVTVLVTAAALCFTFLPSTSTTSSKQDKKPAAVGARAPRVAEKKSQSANSIPGATVEKEQTPDPETTTTHTNHKEQSWELHLGRTKSPIDVGAGVKMQLVRTDWKRRLFTIYVFVDGKKIEFKDKPIDQPIWLDASKLVIHGVGKDRIDGTMTVTY